jgi:hypothetical protein
MRRLLLLWLAVNIVGFGVLGAMFHNFPVVYNVPPGPWRLGGFSLQPAILGGILFGAVPAMLVAFAQRWVLRPAVDLSWWWLGTVPVGVGLSHFMLDGYEYAADLSGAVFLGGLAMGLAQWAVLRRALSGSGWWIPACLLGWLVGWVVGVAALESQHQLRVPWEGGLDFRQHATLGLTIGISYGLATGLVLARRLRLLADG